MLLQEGLTEKTWYGYLTVVKQLCKWAAGPSVRLIPTNLLASVHLEEPVPTQQPCFTPEQVGTLIGSADAHRRRIGEGHAAVDSDIGNAEPVADRRSAATEATATGNPGAQAWVVCPSARALAVVNAASRQRAAKSSTTDLASAR
ncbi:MAG: hypothetical protein KA354_23145 [Phycisphaerae bacterium]|nr:hypothetical protein [Phycisphaerae bacterium]